VNALLENPDALERAVAEPGCVPALIEETLRWDAPIQFVFRNTTRDTELGGVAIPKGRVVIPLLGSANRDERRFADADRFDFQRDMQGHVGFGFGAHFCLGASLARLEATAALEALLPELPGRVRAGAEFPLVDSYLVRGRQSLQIAAA
jgi:cytochrome P450